MGTNIDFLQQKGLVNFTKDSKDRRKKILSLSPRCHANITKFKKTSDLWVAEKIRQTLSPSEQKQLLLGVKLLEKIFEDNTDLD